MKRFIFSVCALAAVVVGCSKSEVLNRPNAEVPIQFNPYTGRIPVTKGTASDIDTLGNFGFQVYAFMHGANDPVDYAVTPYMNKVVKYVDGSWTYSGNAYWPATNVLDFIAYGLNTEDLVTTTDDEHVINFTVPQEVSEQRDLLVAKSRPNMAYSEGDGANNGVVDFTFSHLLSRIGFSLVTKDNNAVKVTIEKLDLTGNFHSTGSVDLALSKQTEIQIGENKLEANRPYITPTGEASSITYSLIKEGEGSFTSAASAYIYDNSMLFTKNDQEGTDNDEYVDKTDKTKADEAKAAANAKNRYMMLIPSENHAAKLHVKYFLPGAGTFEEVTVDLKDVPFEAGKSYDFKLKVSTNGISFSVTVEDWDVTGENREVIELN